MSSRSSVERAPARCSGGHGFNSCRGLRFFCPTLVSCWSFHLSHFITELKIIQLYLLIKLFNCSIVLLRCVLWLVWKYLLVQSNNKTKPIDTCPPALGAVYVCSSFHWLTVSLTSLTITLGWLTKVKGKQLHLPIWRTSVSMANIILNQPGSEQQKYTPGNMNTPLAIMLSNSCISSSNVHVGTS